jgi:outer membrane receptor protein involved in Fe transport
VVRHDFGKSGTTAKDESRLLELRYDGDVSNGWQPSLRIYNGSYRFDGDYNYDPDPNTRDRARADWTGTEAQLTYTGIAQHKVVVGVDAQWNTRVEQQYYEADSGDMILDTNDTSRTVGLYAQDEWRFHPQWLLNASLRYDKHSDFDAVTSPRAALIWQPTQRLTLKGIVGSSYRTPNAYERFYNDNGDSQNANPDLQPEEVASVELAAAYRFGQSGRVGLSVYRNEITDLIDQVTDDAGVSTFINQDKVHARGVEVEAENRWAGGVSLRGSVAWQESEKDDGSELVDSPNWLGKVVLGVPIAFGWTASGEILGVAAREGDNGPVPGYGIVNLSVFSAPAARFGQFSLSIYNLGDKKYDDPTSNYMLHESIEQNGRQFRLRWTLPL